MTWIEITIGAIPIVIYSIIWLAVNAQIKQRIPNKSDRKIFKKENDINRTLNESLAFLIGTSSFLIWMFSSIEPDEVLFEMDLFIPKFILLLSFIFLSIAQMRRLLKVLKTIK